MRWLVVLCLLGTVKPSEACMLDGPCPRWDKDLMARPVVRYVRTARAQPPGTNRDRIVKFLVGSTWKAMGNGADRRDVMFVDPTKLTERGVQRKERVVLIRRIEVV